MKRFLWLLVVACLCQRLPCENVPSNYEYEKPTGGVFIQGELPKHGISSDKVRTNTSSQVNITRVRVEEVPHETTTKEPEPLAEAQTEPQAEPQAEPETEPQAELVAITDQTFLPCSFMPCPLHKKTDKNPRFRPVTVRNSNSKPKDVELTDTHESYQLYLQFYDSLSFHLLLITLLCLTMVLMTAIFVAVYVAKNSFGLKRFRKLENQDCGLSKYNF